MSHVSLGKNVGSPLLGEDVKYIALTDKVDEFTYFFIDTLPAGSVHHLLTDSSMVVDGSTFPFRSLSLCLTYFHESAFRHMHVKDCFASLEN